MRALQISTSLTTRDDDSLDRYFNDLKKISLLSASEELQLIPRIRRGEKEALSRLVTGNLRFVVSVAKQYQNKGVSISDLINEGNVGLIKAAKKFDESRGCKFISYAVWWIRQSIQIAVIEQSRMVHLPYSFNTLMSKFKKGTAKLEQAFKREPTIDEVAHYLDVDPDKIKELVVFSSSEVSLDKPVNYESGSTLHDIIASRDHSMDMHLQKQGEQQVIRNSLAILTDTEKEILTLYFGLDLAAPLSLDDISQRLCLPIQRVRRAKEGALIRLRRSSYAPLLKSCLN